MTRGWCEVARAYHAEGALAIYFEYYGASTLFFKVFDEEGRRLECCPGGDRQRGEATGVVPTVCPVDRSSSSSDDSSESSDSPEPSESLESSDDSYVPPSSRRGRSAVVVAARHHQRRRKAL